MGLVVCEDGGGLCSLLFLERKGKCRRRGRWRLVEGARVTEEATLVVIALEL